MDLNEGYEDPYEDPHKDPYEEIQMKIHPSASERRKGPLSGAWWKLIWKSFQFAKVLLLENVQQIEKCDHLQYSANSIQRKASSEQYRIVFSEYSPKKFSLRTQWIPKGINRLC